MSGDSFKACLDYLAAYPESLRRSTADGVDVKAVVREFHYGSDPKQQFEIVAETNYRSELFDLLYRLEIPSRLVNKGRVYEILPNQNPELLVISDFDGVKQFRGILPGNVYAGIAVNDERGLPLGSALIDIISEDLYYTRGPGSQVIFKEGGSSKPKRIKSPKKPGCIEDVLMIAPNFKDYGKPERHTNLQNKFGPFRERLVSGGTKEIPLSGLGYVAEILEGRLDLYNTSNEHDLDKVRIVSEILANAGGVVVELEHPGAPSNPWMPRIVSPYGITPHYPDIYAKIRRGDFLAAPNEELYRDALRVINETCVERR